MINLNNINIEEIKNILVKNNIEMLDEEVDPDEVQIKNNSEDKNEFSIYIKADAENNSLRIYGMSHFLIMHRNKSLKNNELLEVINMMNLGSSVIKYSVISNNTLTFEYGIPLSGKISDEHLMHVFDFVINEISVLDGIFDEFLKVVRKLKK